TDLDVKLNWLKRHKPDTFSWHPLLRQPGSLLYQETGEKFFETQDWTRDNVRGFYAADIFSEVTPEERKHWTQSRLEPFSRKHHRLARLRLTPMQRWPQMFFDTISRRVKNRMEQFSR
ncbi:MAG: hypothetical protein CVU72_05850, partial [Deltaproteobacteria bacterium HGW-Deltaproteobacteria-7]